MNKKEYKDRVPIDKSNICIYRDLRKCASCGACKGICKSKIGVYDNYDMKAAKKSLCIYCGQCSLVCPNNSIKEVSDYKKVKKEISKGKVVIAQIAPATRFLIGEEFGCHMGMNTVRKLITSLKQLGVSYVVDTAFGADLTICEEANEFINRLKNNERLPLFTSCCPSWVRYAELFYKEYLPNLSTCKSPVLMTGAVIKNYYLKKLNIDEAIVVAVVPCVSKKYEITKTNDVDYAITVREMVKWIKEKKIDFANLPADRFDQLIGTSSGIIFGASGGVTEAMIRYTYHRLTGNNPPKKLLNFESVRGLTDVKEANIKIKDYDLSIAIINGTGDVPKVIDKIKNEEKHYDIIEVMACDGGCIAGGGTPKVNKVTNVIKNKRTKGIYKADNKSKKRNSYENKKVTKLYKELLIRPNSDMAHKLLHMEAYDEK